MFGNLFLFLLIIQKKDLPTTFRINETEPSSDIIKHNLRTKYHFDGTVEFEGQQVSCVHPIEWCGDDGAWQVAPSLAINAVD